MKLPQLQRDREFEAGGGWIDTVDNRTNTNPPIFPIAAIMLLIGLIIGFLIGKLV